LFPKYSLTRFPGISGRMAFRSFNSDRAWNRVEDMVEFVFVYDFLNNETKIGGVCL
jgi:hypothetical protein